MNRRDFLKYVGAGASIPFVDFFQYKKKGVETLTPFVFPPDDFIPGFPKFYATVCRECPAGCGVHAKMREGNIIKLEGNPGNPVNEGKLCARGQAGLQALYNPDRVKGPMARNGGSELKRIGWKKALTTVSSRLQEVQQQGAADGVVFLTEPLRGSLSGLITKFMDTYGSDQFFSYDFLNDDAANTGNELAFGSARLPHYDIDNAKYIISFGASFLDTWFSPVRYSVGYGKFRDRKVSHRGWLVQCEPRISATGANADHWLSTKPGSEGALALGFCHVILREGLQSPDLSPEEISEWRERLSEYDPETVSERTGVPAEEIEKIGKEFALTGPSLAICGGPATAHVTGTFNAVAVNVLNHLAGSVGRKGGVQFPAPSFLEGEVERSISYKGLTELAQRMEDGTVRVLFLNRVNPVFSTPEAVRFEEALRNVPLVISFSPFMDESAEHANLILPDQTFLESWGDYVPLTEPGKRAVGFMQPTMEPLFGGRQIGDVMLDLAKSVGGPIGQALPQQNFLAYLKDAWRPLHAEMGVNGAPQVEFDKFFEGVVQDGGWYDKASLFIPPEKSPGPDILDEVDDGLAEEAGGDFPYSLCLYASSGLYDGRGANKPWLQELPEPLVTITWSSWVEIGPKLAKELKIKEGDHVTVESPSGEVEVPAYIFQAMGSDIVSMPIGQGHDAYGRWAKGRGVNPLKMVGGEVDEVSGTLAWSGTKVRISKAGGWERLIKYEAPKQVGLEDGVRMMGREIVESVPLDEAKELEDGERLERVTALPSRDLRKGSRFLSQIGLGKFRESKYHTYKNYRWGMVIDLDKCTGCQACVVACRAENNIPWAGPVRFRKQQEIFWMRVDRYWEGDYPEIQAKQMPMLCYHCGNAPCEPVCPVYAPFHSVDGLNGQVYNRCIGTRFCGVNCPYKARHFNYWAAEWPEPMNRMLNPDMSVRPQGVMEKCSFCVQRLRLAKDKAKDEGRLVRDGEVVPACVQTCPSNAMTFGNLSDAKSEVSKKTRDPRRYRLLHDELQTQPAVVYLKAVKEHVRKSRRD
ncbi:MAG: molybdopterin-dependent oxidoreductase [Terriglobia bacterium]